MCLAEDMTVNAFLAAADTDLLKPKPDMILSPVVPIAAAAGAAPSQPFTAANLVTPEAYQKLFQLLTTYDDVGQAA